MLGDLDYFTLVGSLGSLSVDHMDVKTYGWPVILSDIKSPWWLLIRDQCDMQPKAESYVFLINISSTMDIFSCIKEKQYRQLGKSLGSNTVGYQFNLIISRSSNYFPKSYMCI